MPYKNKEDQNKAYRKWYAKQKHKWTVYKLDDGTVGISQSLKKRMQRYKYEKGYTGGHKILWKFNRPEPAIIVEALYHWMGYKGCAYAKESKQS